MVSVRRVSITPSRRSEFRTQKQDDTSSFVQAAEDKVHVERTVTTESEIDAQSEPLTDPFGRRVSYLRVSVTDRCDFRCVYCMPAQMKFLPRKEVLSLEELDRLCSAFVRKGVKKLRLTGGEPLVRKNVQGLVRTLSRHLDTGDLEELTLTTNASLLHRYAGELASYGVRRINVSLDTRDPDQFKAITRIGNFDTVMRGIDTALNVGMQVKINMVALKGVNEHEIADMLRWVHGMGMDMTLIETMPMGDVEPERDEQFLALSDVRADLERDFTLTEIPYKTGGPARYVEVAETGGRLGFITPMTHNFCESCNRVRLTCTGTLYMCLGQDDAVDLRAVLRASNSDFLLNAAIEDAISRKPRGHDFLIDRLVSAPSVVRHMSVTGG